MLRVAVVGLGRMGGAPSSRLSGQIPAGWLPLSHTEAVSSVPGLSLVALCDRDAGRLEEVGSRYPGAQLYADWREMLRIAKPDLLMVATRTDVRCQIMAEAIESGVKGIYAEKPLSQNLQICEEVLALAADQDCKIVYGATRRAMDIYRKAREICWSGQLGEVLEVTVEFGSSPLLWTMPHAADLACYFSNCSRLDWVQGMCEGGPIDRQAFLIDCDPVVVHAFAQFANGVSAVFSKSRSMNVQIACSEGSVAVVGDGEELEIRTRGSQAAYFHQRELIPVEALCSGTQYLLADLRDSVLGGLPVQTIRPDEILCGQQLLFGILESSRRDGCKVLLAEISRELTVTGLNHGRFA